MHATQKKCTDSNQEKVTYGSPASLNAVLYILNEKLVTNSFVLLIGTTWTQELVWLLINNCDTEAAKRTPIDLRSPFLEYNQNYVPYYHLDIIMITFTLRLPYLVAEGNPIWDPIRFPIESINAMPLTQRRMIKTHLPFYLLNPKLIDTCKV